MKIKLLLIAALIGAASLSANAGVRFCFSFGIPLPVPVVAVAPPAPVVVAAPAVAVAPVVAVAPAYVPAGYAWAPGHWAVCGCSRVWVSGCWHYRAYCAPHYSFAHPYGWRR